MGLNLDPARIVKTAAVFIAGVVISVGSALIYSIHQQRKMDERTRAFLQRRPTPAAKTSPSVEPSSKNSVGSDSVAPDSATESATSSERSHAEGARTNPRPLKKPNASPARPKRTPPDPPDSTAFSGTRASIEALPRISPEPGPSVPVTPPHAAPTRALAQHATAVTLDAGTALTIRLEEALSNTANRTGDTFRATLDAPLMRNGIVLAERGSAVLGRVVLAQRSHLIHGTAELALTLTQFTVEGGRSVPVQTNSWERIGARNGLFGKAKKLVGAAVDTVSGAVSEAAKAVGVSSEMNDQSEPQHRDQLLVPADTQITFRLVMPVTITANPDH